MAYQGRSTGGLDSHNFGGINTRNGLVNLAHNEAMESINFDIAPDGAITRRNGFTLIASSFTKPQVITVFFRFDKGRVGQEWWSIISNGKFWEASDPYGTWIDQTGATTFTYSADTVVVGYRGAIFAANGIDQPIYQKAGVTATTLRLASVISPPTGLAIQKIGSPTGSAQTYYIASQSGQGITDPVMASVVATVGITATGSDYNRLVWVPSVSAVSQKIYKSQAATLAAGEFCFQIVTILDPGIATFDDNGAYPVTSLTFNKAPVGTNTYQYIVTSFIGMIEQDCAYAKGLNLGPVNSGLSTQSVAVNPVVGATKYALYVFMAAGTYTGERADNFNGGISVTISHDGFYKIRESTATLLTDWASGGLSRGSLTYPLTEWMQAPTIYPAVNTPADWDKNGQPQGFAVLAGPKSERLLAWRGGTIWASALQNGLDWYQPNDAYTFSLTGEGDRNIKAIGHMLDYSIAFSATQGFVYYGTTAVDIIQVKIIPIGCASWRALTHVDFDLWFWSRYGPTSLRRVLTGQDIQPNTGISANVNSIINQSNRSLWSNLVGYSDIPNNRVIYCYPSTGATANDTCLVFNTLTNGWVQYTGWNLVDTAIDSLARVFALTTDGKLVQLAQGNLDGGAIINATYKTAWYDLGTLITRKRLLWVDVIGDRQGGPYTFTINASFDYGLYTDVPITCTETTTDGVTVETTSSKATFHRVYTDGFGESFQLAFATSAGDTPVKILGWRPDTRFKGIRGNG